LRAADKNKESGLRGPGFDFTPEGWCLLSDNQWNDGKMEYWGYKMDDGLILFSDQCHLNKNGSPPAKSCIPTFQYSIFQRHLFTA
jgi:hypothetical protein